MKHIVKHPENLSQIFAAKIEEKGYDAAHIKEGYYKKYSGAYIWRRVKKLEGFDELKEQLLEEQGYTCCYCNCELQKNTSSIEHIFPKGDNRYKHLVADYGNMIVSCPGGGAEGRRDSTMTFYPEYCGRHKGNDMIPISPIHANCETAFSYHLDGKVEGLSPDAETTIAILNLNCPTLVQRRLSALGCLYLNGDQAELLDNKDLKTLHEALGKKEQGKYTPFFFVIRNVIEGICNFTM